MLGYTIENISIELDLFVLIYINLWVLLSESQYLEVMAFDFSYVRKRALKLDLREKITNHAQQMQINSE